MNEPTQAEHIMVKLEGWEWFRATLTNSWHLKKGPGQGIPHATIPELTENGYCTHCLAVWRDGDHERVRHRAAGTP